MAGQKFTLTFDANLNVSQMKGALGQIQSTLNVLHLPQNMTRGLTNTLANLEKELRNFEVAAGKDLQQKGNFNALQKTAEKISSLFADIKIQARDLGLHNDLDKFFPKEVVNNITKANDALNDYKQALKQITTAQNREQSKLRGAVAKQTVAQSDLEAAKEQLRIQQELQKINLTNIFKAAKITAKDIFNPQEIEQAIAKIKELQEKAQNVQNNIGPNGKTYNYADSTKAKYAKQYAELEQLISAYQQMPAAIQNAENALDKAQSAYDKATDTVRKYREQIKLLEQDNSTKSDKALQKLWDDISKLNGIDISKYGRTLEEAKRALSDYEQAAGKDVQDALDSLNNVINQNSHAYDENAEAVRRDTERYREFDTQARDIEGLKSRIQAFFGLSNAINLVKRTMREAFNTIKELDKAMTETAVVTDFSVGDMWAQLPEYTKRANELGVTTKAAYEAATLYYQQGLKTNEVMAMSNETLKMARIAGLDAAVATDRMTNAIRGFNMEINTTNAQRIDDVYSKLAAISASNVDEISTAMTKVASLAHNANMEFETTAAFLAQIIETTRESAETAGTALKTVVARFSEVKKLVSEGELKGNDDEGELIDVNKVSQALRTAGIDLNKYFLGEVGLDDIFMELASKWDSLTTMQQRYIATQAAGSRQQSRFIALMSDYARTQELVGEAYNANGAAAKQFAKTQESLESKLARLKNAWNEFAMGILNSDLVKVGVDLLTNILNGINALTSGFGLLDEGVGGVINSVSKLILLFGSLGAMKTLLSGLGTSITNIGLAATGKTPFNVVKAMSTAAVGANATGTLAGLAGRGKGGALLAGFLNPFAGIGNVAKAGAGKVWGAAKNLGTFATGTGTIMGSGFGKWGIGAGLSGSAGMTAGLTGIATAFVGIAIAIGGAVLAYKAWEKYTPSGQLHAARKYAEEMQKVADGAKASSQSIQQLKNSYEQYSQAVEQASTLEERRNAIQERNNAILEAIDKNSDYARFLDTDFDVTGELVLTLDADKVTEAAIEAAEEATKAAITSYIANAEVAQKKAAKIEEDSKVDVDWYNNLIAEREARKEGKHAATGSTQMLYWTDEALDNAIKEAEAELAVVTGEISNTLEESTGQLRLAYSQMLSLSNIDLDSELSSALVDVLSKINDTTIPEETVIDLAKQLVNGTLDTNILSAAVADGLSSSLAKIDLDDDTKLIETFGIAEDAINNFANAIGKEPSVIYDVLRARAKEIQALQKQQRVNIFESMLKNNARLNEDIVNFINGLNSDDLKTTLELLTSSGDLLGKQGQQALYGELQGLLESGEAQSLINLFNSINLDNPIKSFKILNQTAAEGSKYAQEYAKKILEINQDTFSKSNMLQAFLSSDDYEKVAESISKIYKENNRLTPKNLEELASESEELKAFLDNDIVSLRQLTEVLKAVNSGAPLGGLTDNVLEAFEATEGLDNLIQELHDTIQNFNAGLDFGEGDDFVVNLADQLLEMTENREFHNETYKNIYNQLFGKDAYDEFIKGYGTKGVEAFTADTIAQLQQLKQWAEDESYEFMLQSAQGLTGIEGISGGPDNFTWDIGNKTTEQLRDYIASTLKISSDSAMSIITGAMAHLDLQKELDTNDYNARIQALVDSTTNGAKITHEQLEAIAKTYGTSIGKSIEQVQTDIESVANNGIEPKTFDFPVLVNWTDENGNPLTGKLLTDKFDSSGIKASESVQAAIDRDTGTINIDKLFAALSEQGLSEDQSKEIAEHIRNQLQTELNADGNGLIAKFSKEIEVTSFKVKNDEIQVQVETATVTSDSLKGLDGQIAEKIGLGLKDADYSLVSNGLADLEFDEVTGQLQKALDAAARVSAKNFDSNYEPKFDPTKEKLAGALYQGMIDGLKQAQDYANTHPVVIKTIQKSFSNATALSNQWAADLSTNAALREKFRLGGSGAFASGGIQFSQPGWALTGEEAPEIVWNKEKGYAYITGANGPEFRMLQPGDRVFNAQETSRILGNTLPKGKQVKSLASGSYNSSAILARRAGDDNGSSGANEPTITNWRNEFDWLYNLMEDIAELQRTQTKLQEEQNKILEVGNNENTGKDLFENLIKQIANLTIQKEYQTQISAYRRREMDEFMATNAAYGSYFRFNNIDQTLEIDWDAIENIGDKETYDRVRELVSQAEEIQDKMDDAEDAIREAESQLRALENVWRDQYVSFEKRVLDALVKSYQRIIDNYSDLNNTVTQTNNDILNALQDEIALERQIRDNTKTEGEISDAEARLAFLRRDTTGGNQVEILRAQRSLDENRQQYEDTLVDQAVSRLQEDNNKAAEQRQRQIDLMQAQLNYAAENGEFNDEVQGLITGALGADGELLTNSDLFSLLQQEESWAAMSDVSREVWEDELNNTFKEVSAYLLKDKSDADGTLAAAIQSEIQAAGGTIGAQIGSGLHEIGLNIGSMSQAMQHTTYTYNDAANGLNWADIGLDSQVSDNELDYNYSIQTYGSGGYTVTQNGRPIATVHQGGSYSEVLADLEDLKKLRGYKTGGLTSKTGLAWLDGTPSEPEYVLNARQTEAFLKLADVLPSMFNGTSTTNSTIGGNMYLEFHVNVDSISSDYDVDQLVERVKDDIYSAASYRNANVISLSR